MLQMPHTQQLRRQPEAHSPRRNWVLRTDRASEEHDQIKSYSEEEDFERHAARMRSAVRLFASEFHGVRLVTEPAAATATRAAPCDVQRTDAHNACMRSAAQT